MFRCKLYRRIYNERSNTQFNYVEVPTDIIFQVIFCRVRYKLSIEMSQSSFCLEGLSSLT
ncbi:hypothetical protein Xen7305DRAFT_00051970, partial [Xenococcus sp. PCC 7305]